MHQAFRAEGGIDTVLVQGDKRHYRNPFTILMTCHHGGITRHGAFDKAVWRQVDLQHAHFGIGWSGAKVVIATDFPGIITTDKISPPAFSLNGNTATTACGVITLFDDHLFLG